MKRKWLKIILITLGFLFLVEVIFLVISFFRAPKIADQVEPGSSVLHVGLSGPQSDVTWPLNSHLPLRITVTGSQIIRKVDLYVNGTLYESMELSKEKQSTSFADTWNWQPGTIGQFILVAHAEDVNGATGISQPVLLVAGDASFTVTPVDVKTGDTLADIASENGQSVEDVVAANPGLDPASPLKEGDLIIVPNQPGPVTNPKIIPGFELPAEVETPPEGTIGTPPQDQSGDQLTPVELPDIATQEATSPGDEENAIPPISQLDNFKFWLKFNLLPLLSANKSADSSSQSPEQNPPPKPYVKADFKECNVTIKLVNSAAYYDPIDPAAIKQDEDGFFLYRSRDGGSFERIATWPKIVNFMELETDLFKWGYNDNDQFGLVTYYLASFAGGLEVPGDPVSLPLDEAGCKKNYPFPVISSSPYLEDGVLHLPFGMDLAYFYIQTDLGNNLRSRGWRVPEGNRSFLPESGMQLNLYTYLNTILDKLPSADMVLYLQVWGWSGNKLIHAGDFKVNIHRAVLLICSVEGEGGCTGGGGGQWLPEINISNLKPVNEQKYEVRWLASDISPLNDVCVELAAGPYPNDDYWQVNLPISSYCFDPTGYEGVFMLDLGLTLYPAGPKDAGQWGNYDNMMDFDSNWFQFDYPVGSPFTLYMRAFPRHQVVGFNRKSNIAVMHYNTPPLPSEMPPLASTLSSIYNVEILEETYSPPVFSTNENWGCVVVDEDPTGTYYPGQVVCPPDINTGHDDCAGQNELVCLLKGFANSLGWLYDYVVYGWDQMKWQYAKWIAETIPYCAASDDCVSVVKMGIDYGLQYVSGIPANPPASEDLIADSIASFIVDSAVETEKYYTGLDVSAIETYCETVTNCKEELSKKIKQNLKQSRSIASQQACVAPYEAYFHGKQPTCLDPSIIVHPYAGSGNYPGSISIRITRKVDLQSMGANQSDADKYRLDISVIGQNYYNNDNIYGPLFQTTRLEIPWIAPGQSFVMTATLQLCKDQTLPGCGGGVNYYGIEGLYFGATAHMKAVEACYSTGSSWEWVPCLEGGADTWDYKNPSDKYNLEVGQP